MLWGHNLGGPNLPQCPSNDGPTLWWDQHQTLHRNHDASSLFALDLKVGRLGQESESAVCEKDRLSKDKEFIKT
jgi:hypothetical protein